MGYLKNIVLSLSILITSCSVGIKKDDYELVPKTATIGLPDWLGNVNVTYEFKEKSSREGERQTTPIYKSVEDGGQVGESLLQENLGRMGENKRR